MSQEPQQHQMVNEEDNQNPHNLIDLESYLPRMIETFSQNVDLDYEIYSFQMKIEDDGITLCDSRGLIYELNTGSQEFFEKLKEKIVTIEQGIVKPEFELNTQNLIFTLYANNIKLSEGQEGMEEEIAKINNNLSVNARFKIFDMEHNKKNQDLYEKSFVIKKALVRKHSLNAILAQGANIWVSFTQSYKLQQQQVEEEKAKQLKQQQNEQNKKSGGKKETSGTEKEKDEDEKKQQFKTPSKKTKTPLKVSKNSEGGKAPSTKKDKKSAVNKQGNMEVEAEEDDENNGEGAAEGAVSVAKERQVERKHHLIKNQRKNLQSIYEQEGAVKKQNNKKRTVQIDDAEYEEEDIDEESNDDAQEEEEEVNEEESEHEQEAEKQKKIVEDEMDEEEVEVQNKKQKVQKKSVSIKDQDEEDIVVKEKPSKLSVLKPVNTEKQKEIIQSLKKKSVQKMKEEKEREENEQQIQAQLLKQEQYKQKLEKLQKFVLKREFLYYVQDFQKKPEVRNAVLPRDPQDKEKMKQYPLKVVKYLESQYK